MRLTLCIERKRHDGQNSYLLLCCSRQEAAMKKEKQKDFSTRIVQAGRVESLVIVYEMLQEELREAIENHENRQLDGFEQSMTNAQKILHELMGTLDYSYRISYCLLSIYRFINRVIASGKAGHKVEQLSECIAMIGQLRDAYEKNAKELTEQPMMKNVEKVYAGLTYGRTALSEVTVAESRGTRGLYA